MSILGTAELFSYPVQRIQYWRRLVNFSNPPALRILLYRLVSGWVLGYFERFIGALLSLSFWWFPMTTSRQKRTQPPWGPKSRCSRPMAISLRAWGLWWISCVLQSNKTILSRRSFRLQLHECICVIFYFSLFTCSPWVLFMAVTYPIVCRIRAFPNVELLSVFVVISFYCQTFLAYHSNSYLTSAMCNYQVSTFSQIALVFRQ